MNIIFFMQFVYSLMSWITHMSLLWRQLIIVWELVSVKCWCTVIEERESTHSSYKEFTDQNTCKICEIPEILCEIQ